MSKIIGKGERARNRWILVAGVVVALGVSATAVAASGVLSPGDVIPRAGAPVPPPENRLDTEEIVLKTGRGTVAGDWRLTAYAGRDGSEQSQEPLPCVRMTLSAPPAGSPLASSGFCGEAGDGSVMAASLPVRNQSGEVELFVFGTTPARAAEVRLAGADGLVASAPAMASSANELIAGNVFVIDVPAEMHHAELSWVSDAGRLERTSVDTSGFFDRREAFERLD